MNIVSMAMNFVGPAVIDKIARSLGINGTLARTAISTALPAIMAAMAGKGSSAQGAGSILDMVRNKGASGLQNLDTMFGGSDEAQRIEEGHRELTSVLGGSEMGPIMQAVSRFTGIEENKSHALLGMMAPVAMGTIGEEVSRQRLDANGLSHFLGGQQANIADALPDGFADHVTGSTTFDTFRTNLMGATATANTTARPVEQARDHVEQSTQSPGTVHPTGTTHPTGTAHPTGTTHPTGTAHPTGTTHPTGTAPQVDTAANGGPVTRKSGGILGWLIGLIAIAGIGWYAFTNFIAPGADIDAPAGIEQSLGGSEIGTQLSESVSNISTSLESVTDEASARAALPDLTAANENLGALQEMAGNLPEGQQGAMGGMISTAMQTLEPMIERVRDIPGVGGVLGPVLDGIVEKMSAMAG